MQVTKENIAAFLAENGLAMLKFGATWCSPCKAMKPVIEAVANDPGMKAKGLVVGEIDIEASPEIAVQYSVQTIPTYILFKNGAEIGRLSSKQTQQWMLVWINSRVSVAEAA